MARWVEIAKAVPELAELAEGIFGAHIHKTMATLRKDGSPRISGTEIQLVDGDYWLGSMPGALKARDLQRDPSVAVHSATVLPDPDDPSSMKDAKIAGRAIEASPPAEVAGGAPDPGGSHYFRLDITEVVVTRVGEPKDHILIQSWHEGRGFSEAKR